MSLVNSEPSCCVAGSIACDLLIASGAIRREVWFISRNSTNILCEHRALGDVKTRREAAQPFPLSAARTLSELGVALRRAEVLASSRKKDINITPVHLPQSKLTQFSPASFACGSDRRRFVKDHEASTF